MKRSLSLLLMLLVCVIPLAPAAAQGEGEALIVGSTTMLSGAFFTGMWGNNTSDIDVRTLLHGYSPVVWTMQTLYETDPMVIKDITAGTYENGNKVFTIELQEDLTYNDGTPITAADYVFSILLHASPVLAELGATVAGASHIDGYDAYRQGSASTFAGVRLLGDYRYSVEVKAEHLPYFYELAMLDFPPYPIAVIAPGCAVADDGQGAYIQGDSFTPERLSQSILDAQSGYLSQPRVTSGPYQLEAYDAQAGTASFTANPRYKGNYQGQKPTIERVAIRNVTPETMAGQLESGEVHLLNKCVDADTITEGLALYADGEMMYANYPRMGLGFVAFACEQGPTQFEAVRQAVAHALDVEAFCDEYTTVNYGVPVYGYYGIGQWMVQRIASSAGQGESIPDDEAAQWDALTLGVLNQYPYDLAQAEALLAADGWTLDAQGNAYTGDGSRHKQVGETLMPLTLRYAKTQDSIAAQLVEDMLSPGLDALGIALEVTALPFTQMLESYYSQGDRAYDMMYLATNFHSPFDPYMIFGTNADFDGTLNTTGLHDAELEALALALRRTESGNLLEYCQKWLAFQQQWNEKLPMLPLYSNIYFDFHIPQLQGYAPQTYQNWPTAILYAHLAQ